MSVHVNPDGSDSAGVKIEGEGKFVAHDLAVAVTSSTQLPGAAAAQTAGATMAVIQADGNGNVRYRLDGTAPTVTTGFVLVPYTIVTLSIADAINAKFIDVTSSTSVINATYTL